MDLTVRPATAADVEPVADFTEGTWPDRRPDYLPRVFDRWVSEAGEDRRPLVAVADGRPVGVVHVALLGRNEAWCQGLRIHPQHRRRGIAERLTTAAFDWAADRGAVVARVLVFAWNAAGLGFARAVGFEPVSAFRWGHPEPDAGDAPAHEPPTVERIRTPTDAGSAWQFWQRSDARTALAGLALAADEPWTLVDLDRSTLEAAAREGRLLVVADGGIRAFAFHRRDLDRDGVRWAEYGAAAWTDRSTARWVLAGIARDAADRGADRIRVPVPETARALTAVAGAGVDLGESAYVVLAADLTA